MEFVEPPSCSPRIVLIGKNRRGRWVAQHQNDLYGGLFTHRADAVRYALFENGHHPEAIIMIGCVLELDMTTLPTVAVQTLAAAVPEASQREGLSADSMTIHDNSWLTGVIADLPTPFDADGELDLAAFGNLCEKQIAAGPTALLVGETVGEMATLTTDEHDTLVRTAVKTSHGRAKVISGAGSNGTCQAIDLTQRAEAAGADAVMSVVPYYNKPTQAGIEAHIRAIADATSLPIVLHDNPACCVREPADDTLLRLSGNPSFIGLRDGGGDTTRPLRLRARLPSGFRLLSGDDATALTYLVHGGDGFVSAVANITPELDHEMFRACRQSEVLYASTLMDRLAPLCAAFAPEGTPSSIKYALGLRSLCSPQVRLPMVALQGQQKAAITEAMAAVLGP